MAQRPHRIGDRVLLDDGEVGVIIGTDDDGTAQVRTESGILVSSCLDDLSVDPSPGA
jgi:hypothetical protein